MKKFIKYINENIDIDFVDFDEEEFNHETENMDFVDKMIKSWGSIVILVFKKDWENCCNFLVNNNIKWICKRTPVYNDTNIKNRKSILLIIRKSCKNEIGSSLTPVNKNYNLKFYSSIETYAEEFDEGETIYYSWEKDKINQNLLTAHKNDENNDYYDYGDEEY